MSDPYDLTAAVAEALRNGAGAGGNNDAATRATDEAVTNSQTTRS